MTLSGPNMVHSVPGTICRQEILQCMTKKKAELLLAIKYCFENDGETYYKRIRIIDCNKEKPTASIFCYIYVKIQKDTQNFFSGLKGTVWHL